MTDIGQIFQQMLYADGSGGFMAHAWLYPVLLLMVLVEGPFAILIASSAATTGFLYPIPVFITAILGNLIADVLWYTLGASGKVEGVLRWKWLRIDPRALDYLKGNIRQHAVKILFVAKMTNGLIVPALIATGVSRVPWRRWFPMILVTNFLVTGLFVFLGYFTAVNLMKIEHWIRYIAIGFSIVFFVGASAYIQHVLRKKYMVVNYEDAIDGENE